MAGSRFPFDFSRLIRLLIVCMTISCCLPACKDNRPVAPAADTDTATYFSVRQFLDDQWKIRHGQPIAFMRVATFNGVTDTTFVGLDSTLWNHIRTIFDEADIGDPKFLGQYEFSFFTEDRTDVVYLTYQAKDPELFMQKMNIGMDQFNHRIRSLYIETSKKSRIYIRTQKLLYIPDKLIQIQEYENSILSPEKEMKIRYINIS